MRAGFIIIFGTSNVHINNDKYNVSYTYNKIVLLLTLAFHPFALLCSSFLCVVVVGLLLRGLRVLPQSIHVRQLMLGQGCGKLHFSVEM